MAQQTLQMQAQQAQPSVTKSNATDPWATLQAMAAFVTAPGPVPLMLAGCLRWLKDCGCVVERVQGGGGKPGGYKIARGSLDESEWAEAKQTLAPYKEQLRQVLGWLHAGGMPVRSAVLGEPIFVAKTAPADRTTVDGMVVYTEAEIARLKGSDAETLRQVHAAKKALGGRVVEM